MKGAVYLLLVAWVATTSFPLSSTVSLVLFRLLLLDFPPSPRDLFRT